MRKEIKYLNHDAALMCAQNWRYFGYPFKITKINWNKFQVSAKAWVWGHIVLVPDDYA